MITGSRCHLLRISFRICNPLIPGSSTSSVTTSGFSRSICCNALSPSPATPATSTPASAASASRNTRRITAESSTINILVRGISLISISNFVAHFSPALFDAFLENSHSDPQPPPLSSQLQLPCQPSSLPRLLSSYLLLNSHFYLSFDRSTLT